MPLCVVCSNKTDGFIRNGVVACPACKSFFTVNKSDPQSLNCKGGNNDCKIGKDSKTVSSFVSGNGAFFRQLCRKCRFTKCLAVGMKLNTKRSSSCNGPIDHVVMDKQLFMLETQVNGICNGAVKFHQVMNKLDASREPCYFTQQEIAQVALKNFETGSKALIEFVKNLPNYKDAVPLQDRIIMFPVGMSSIILISNATLDEPAPVMGLSLANVKQLVQYQPMLEVSCNRTFMAILNLILSTI